MEHCSLKATSFSRHVYAPMLMDKAVMMA